MTRCLYPLQTSQGAQLTLIADSGLNKTVHVALLLWCNFVPNNNKMCFMKFCSKYELRGKSDTKIKVRTQVILPMNKQPRYIPKVN